MKILNTKHYKIFFFDFDGTLKDSDNIKSKAFIKIFNSTNKKLNEKIKNHHFKNSGISRYKKIPIYMKWNNISLTKKNINLYLKKFSNLTINSVSKAKWIPEAKRYINQIKKDKKIYLITAIPTDEILIILKKLKMLNKFKKVFGSPLNKVSKIREIIKRDKYKKKDCIYFGNSLSDFNAAKRNKIKFVLVNNTNPNFQCDRIKNFKELRVL